MTLHGGRLHAERTSYVQLVVQSAAACTIRIDCRQEQKALLVFAWAAERGGEREGEGDRQTHIHKKVTEKDRQKKPTR